MIGTITIIKIISTTTICITVAVVVGEAALFQVRIKPGCTSTIIAWLIEDSKLIVYYSTVD